jgi:predicted AlkP superfamily phosphohydrolase/phosphomutase
VTRQPKPGMTDRGVFLRDQTRRETLCDLPFLIIVIGALAAFFTLSSCHSRPAQTTGKRVLVLGMDGLDPLIAERLMREGELPNFTVLKERGDFRRLASSIPPLSPVAWSSFITGTDPGGHGIFDFIHRDPATLAPYLSTSRAEGASRTIKLGRWMFPLTGGRVELLRRGKAFWEILAAKGIPATVNGIPANFPPVGSAARSLSGMGTPDIQGTYGTFSFFTDSPPEDAEDLSGGQLFPVVAVDYQVEAALEGPVNTFREGGGTSKVEFAVSIDPEHHVAKIVIQGEEILLNEGEWSDWVRVEFPLIPFLKSVTGICRFYLKEVHPQFKLYVTPINLDPQAPALPISAPPSYAKELVRAIGPFYTQGMPEDTKALNGRILDEPEFLAQARSVLRERLAMLEYELKRFHAGVLFFYISSPDPIQHMFWGPMDTDHPAHDRAAGVLYGGTIKAVYQEMDRIVGRVLAEVDDRTTLIVMSDHGFAPFYRYFNLNTWLKDNGYLVLMATAEQGERSPFQDVDWQRTQAYGLGLNALYLNLQGREPMGSVPPGEKARLLDEIALRLLRVRDPVTHRHAVSRVYKASEVYSGPYVESAPDLIVGYNRGYRASSKTALGEIPAGLFGDNKEKWSGDHAMAAELVPGVLFSNKKVKVPDPALPDLAVTILAEFGIQPAEGMRGRPIF